MSDDAFFNTSIPENITQVFSSLTDGTTLSGPFDIQYRTWRVDIDRFRKTVDRGQPYTKGSYRSLDTLILHDTFEAVEGIIADTINGGIGFRNHTAPLGLAYGGEWSEDITWIEPVTECVDTNLTLEMNVADYEDNITSIDLVDNGGFVNAPRKFDFDMAPSQELDLRTRAYQGAVISNLLLMYQLNVSLTNDTGPYNTTLGRRFTLPKDSFYNPSLYSAKITDLQPDFIQIPLAPSDAWNNSVNATVYVASKNVTQYDWMKLQEMCGSGSGTQIGNITNVAVYCG